MMRTTVSTPRSDGLRAPSLFAIVPHHRVAERITGRPGRGVDYVLIVAGATHLVLRQGSFIVYSQLVTNWSSPGLVDT